MDMSLSKLGERAKDREAWHAAVHAVTESDTTEPLENNLEFPSMIRLQVLRVVTDLVTHSSLVSFPPLSLSSK